MKREWLHEASFLPSLCQHFCRRIPPHWITLHRHSNATILANCISLQSKNYFWLNCHFCLVFSRNSEESFRNKFASQNQTSILHRASFEYIFKVIVYTWNFLQFSLSSTYIFNSNQFVNNHMPDPDRDHVIFNSF